MHDQFDVQINRQQTCQGDVDNYKGIFHRLNDTKFIMTTKSLTIYYSLVRKNNSNNANCKNNKSQKAVFQQVTIRVLM